MSRFKWHVILGSILIGISIIFYLIQYAIFQDAQSIFNNLFTQLGFLPVSVFLVTIVISQLLTVREKRAKMNKLNMVIGAFFSEIGNYLLADLIRYFDNREDISRNLGLSANWKAADFKRADAYAYNLKIDLDIRKIDLGELKRFLGSKRTYLLTLLENPSLLEHDRFTDLLWATTHLDEELEARTSLENLSEADLKHLAGDIQRMYDHLASEWLDYVQHLKANYPFLFSLVLRTHPFQTRPGAEFA